MFISSSIFLWLFDSEAKKTGCDADIGETSLSVGLLQLQVAATLHACSCFGRIAQSMRHAEYISHCRGSGPCEVSPAKAFRAGQMMDKVWGDGR